LLACSRSTQNRILAQPIREVGLMIESFIEHAVVEWPHEIRRCRERIALLSGIAGSAKIIPGWALRLNPDQ
jgi:hypothetical protein